MNNTSSKTKEEGTPVVIRQDLYDIISKQADEKDLSIRKYVFDLLLTVMKRYKHLERRYPTLKVVGIAGHSLIIKESKSGEVAKPVIVDIDPNGDNIKCTSDDSDTCEHVSFARMCPDLLKILVTDEDFFSVR
jgi:hypothetical protein